MDMLGFKKAADKLASHVLRQPEEDVLMKAMDHEVDEKRKHGRPKIIWRERVEGKATFEELV